MHQHQKCLKWAGAANLPPPNTHRLVLLPACVTFGSPVSGERCEGHGGSWQGSPGLRMGPAWIAGCDHCRRYSSSCRQSETVKQPANQGTAHKSPGRHKMMQGSLS